jgi:hypothetical protein
MSNTEEQVPEAPVSKSNKIMRTLGIILVLVILPGMSWFYLKSGLQWRKQAQAELQDYGPIREAFAIWPDGTRDNLVKSKICVIHNFGAQPDLTPVNKSILETAEKLVDQFGFKPGAERDDFRMVMIEEGATSEFRSKVQTMKSSELSNWVWTGGITGWSSTLQGDFDYYCQTNSITPYPKYFALADTSGRVRRFYNAEDTKEVGRMVEHIAMMLPK